MSLARLTLQNFLSESRPLDPLQTLLPEAEAELFREGLLGMAAAQHGLKELYLQAVGRDYRWRQLLSELDEAFGRAGTPVFVFKGGAWLAELYPRPGLRPLSDLDLVGDARARRVLEGMGFRAAPHHPWVLQRGGFQLDLHEHPLSRLQYAFPWDLRRAMQVGLPWGPGRGVYRFLPEDELVIALIHAGKHAYSRWIWLADIALLLQRCQWDALDRSVRLAGAERYLLYARWLLAELRGEPRPRVSRLEQAFLQACLERRAAESWGMLLPLVSIRSPRRAFAYLKVALGPRQGVDWRRRLGELWRLALLRS